MNGIEFIAPVSYQRNWPEFDRIAQALVAPRPYFAQTPLGMHLYLAALTSSVHLTGLDHVNRKSGRRFACVSYYADDPDVVAFCAEDAGVYLTTIGAPFARRLVKICSRLGTALAVRPRASARGPRAAPELSRDEVLGQLLDGDAEVSEAESQEIVARWPEATSASAQIELGEFALFYDLIRLVWLHEWAHALCGHVAFVSGALHLSQLDEFSADRGTPALIAGLNYPRHELLQALEIHADEFAVCYCVRQILWGSDPVADLAGPTIDLIDRLLIFNTACCVFASMWTLEEQRYAPGISFYPPREVPDPGQPNRLFAIYEASHPPAVLRYLRFRGFQRDVTLEYAQRHDARLPTFVDAASMVFLQTLAKLDPRFSVLEAETPMVATTPAMKRLEAYEAYLLGMNPQLSPHLVELGFVPAAPRAGR